MLRMGTLPAQWKMLEHARSKGHGQMKHGPVQSFSGPKTSSRFLPSSVWHRSLSWVLKLITFRKRLHCLLPNAMFCFGASLRPWQALARCFELVEVWTCDAPEESFLAAGGADFFLGGFSWCMHGCCSCVWCDNFRYLKYCSLGEDWAEKRESGFQQSDWSIVCGTFWFTRLGDVASPYAVFFFCGRV